MGQWTHLACTRGGNSNKLTIRIQGLEGPSVDIDGTTPPLNHNGLAVGGNSPSGDPSTGALDEVGVYRVARTAEQICAAAQCEPSTGE